MAHWNIDSPFGALCLTAQDGAITGLSWRHHPQPEALDVLLQAAEELAEYMAGQRDVFEVAMRVDASSFQQDVCAAMRAIPFGQTRTYGDIAKALGVTAQAVGQACGANPIPILIPCHRVMGADGKLVGFSGAGGVETKVALLRHEGAGSFLI